MREGKALQGEVVEKFEDSGRLFVKAFLIDSSQNGNEWGVSQASIPENINTAIGQPLVLTEEYDHPPDGDTLEHWQAIQEQYRIGTIVDVTRSKKDADDSYYAIIEITDPDARAAIQSNEIPMYVSPAIADFSRSLVADQNGTITGVEANNWRFMHLAIVDEPAYGIKRAQITARCGGDENVCLLQLRKAKLKQGYGCGFCVRTALLRLVPQTQTVSLSSHVTKSDNKPSLQLETEKPEDQNPKLEESNGQEQETLNSNPKQSLEQLQTENRELKAKIETLTVKNSELSGLNKSVVERLAALETKDREREIDRILEARIPDDKQRREKVKFYVAKGLTPDDVTEIYNSMPVMQPKKAKLESRVPLTSEDSESEDNELTLRKELAVLNGGYT